MLLGTISGIEPVLSRVWAVGIWEGGATGLGPVWAHVYLWTRILVCFHFRWWTPVPSEQMLSSGSSG